MNFDREHTVAFTGHRDYKCEAESELRITIRALYERGYRRFLSGMARGFDMAAAEAVVALRGELRDIELVAVVPFRSHSSSLNYEERRRYDAIIAAADRVVTLDAEYSPRSYHRRNDFLVDNSSYLVAYFDGSKGGTQYTVTRAHRSHLPVENLYNDLQLQFFKL